MSEQMVDHWKVRTVKHARAHLAMEEAAEAQYMVWCDIERDPLYLAHQEAMGAQQWEYAGYLREAMARAGEPEVRWEPCWLTNHELDKIAQFAEGGRMLVTSLAPEDGYGDSPIIVGAHKILSAYERDFWADLMELGGRVTGYLRTMRAR